MSIIVYTCPKCGGDLQELVLCSYPPQYKKECPKCGYSYIEKSDPIIRVPYVEPTVLEQPKISCADSINYACENCSNHPKNGGSGICNCILGDLQITC